MSTNTLREKLAANLAAELGYQEADPSTGIFDELLQTIIDLVLDLLNGCLVQQSKEKVLGSLRNPGILEGWAIRRAVRLSGLDRTNRKVAENVVTKTLKSASPEECESLLVEVDDQAIDWSIF